MASGIDFVSGCIGGAAGVVIGHPFDTIKVIMQTNSKASIMNILKQYSIRSLYKGIKAPLSGLTAINAMVFGVHGSIMRFCPQDNKRQYYLWCLTSGSMAGLAQSFITCPMELVKTRAQLSTMPVLQCTKHIFQNEGGTRALFRGLGVTLARDMPGLATYFCAYEMLMDCFRTSSKDMPSTTAMLFAGGSAGALSWLVIYPLDVIKSRLQANIQYANTRHCIRDTFEREGWTAFTRGCSPTLLRAFPTNAATFAMVTWTLFAYETHFRKNNDILY